VLRALLARYLEPGLIAPGKIGFGMPGGFMEANQGIFGGLFDAACEALRATRFFGARRTALDGLVEAAPRNINSQWALTVLGMWAESLGAL
jgi:hypothetical protein